MTDIDALVATKIMGWTLRDSGYWFMPEEGEGEFRFRIWQPTQDIAQAWAVVERMRALGWKFDGDWYPGEMPGAMFEAADRSVDFYAEAESMPKAISLAALSALGGAVEGEG